MFEGLWILGLIGGLVLVGILLILVIKLIV